MPRPSDDPVKRANSLANLKRWPGNVNGDGRALKHGAYSVVHIGPLEAVWSKRFADLFGEATEDQWPFFLATVSRCWARLEAVGAWLNLRTADAGRPEVMNALRLEQQLRAEADGYLKRLQLAPLEPGDESSRLRFLLELQERLDAVEQRAAQRPAGARGAPAPPVVVPRDVADIGHLDVAEGVPGAEAE
jgi:hypothetical protein